MAKSKVVDTPHRMRAPLLMTFFLLLWQELVLCIDPLSESLSGCSDKKWFPDRSHRQEQARPQRGCRRVFWHAADVRAQTACEWAMRWQRRRGSSSLFAISLGICQTLGVSALCAGSLTPKQKSPNSGGLHTWKMFFFPRILWTDQGYSTDRYWKCLDFTSPPKQCAHVGEDLFFKTTTSQWSN